MLHSSFFFGLHFVETSVSLDSQMCIYQGHPQNAYIRVFTKCRETRKRRIEVMNNIFSFFFALHFVETSVSHDSQICIYQGYPQSAFIHGLHEMQGKEK